MIHVEREGDGALVQVHGKGDDIMSEIACAITSAVGRGCEMCDGGNEDYKQPLARHIFAEIAKRSAVAISVKYGVNVLAVDYLDDEPGETKFDGSAFAKGLPDDALKCFMNGLKGEI